MPQVKRKFILRDVVGNYLATISLMHTRTTDQKSQAKQIDIPKGSPDYQNGYMEGYAKMVSFNCAETYKPEMV